MKLLNRKRKLSDELSEDSKKTAYQILRDTIPHLNTICEMDTLPDVEKEQIGLDFKPS